MKRKRKLLSNRAIVAFAAVLCIMGYALSASGHFDNPVVAIGDTVAMNTLLTGAESFALPPATSADTRITLTALDTSSDTALPVLSTAADSSLSLPPLDDLSSADLAAPDEGIRWAEIDDAFFDLWFLAAVTALVIVFQHALGFVRARLMARPALSPGTAR